MNRCSGLTKSQGRCGNFSNNNYCHVHTEQARKCMICLVGVQHTIIELSCHHIFHLECLFQLMKHNINDQQFQCPLCRRKYKNYVNEQNKLWHEKQYELYSTIQRVSHESVEHLMKVIELSVEVGNLKMRIKELEKVEEEEKI